MGPLGARLMLVCLSVCRLARVYVWVSFVLGRGVFGVYVYACMYFVYLCVCVDFYLLACMSVGGGVVCVCVCMYVSVFGNMLVVFVCLSK